MTSAMQPTVTAEGRTAHLRYDLPHRIRTSKVYPVKAPNGSTIVLYGYEQGVGVLWRGGRPLKKNASAPKQPPKPPAKVNGTSSATIVIIDSDDEDTSATSAPAPPPPAEFEDEDEELDPDQPYPSFVQNLRLPLNSAVLHIAVPDVPAVSALRPAGTIPTIFGKKLVFTVACADYTVRVITLPLSPPSNAAKGLPPNSKTRFGEHIIKITPHAAHQTIPNGISMTWTSRADPSGNEDQGDDSMDVDEDEEPADTAGRHSGRRKQSRSGSEGWDILVASHSPDAGGLVKLWRFELTDASVSAKTPITAFRTLSLHFPATRLAFNSAQYPRRRHAQLLIADSAGVARVYDPFASPNLKRRTGTTESGGYIALLRATFDRSQTNTSPILTSRKRIVDAAWVSDGQSILALLADGEWGIWDVERTGPNPPSDPSAFSVRGFIGTSEERRSGVTPPSPKKQNKLAPMTPNTRKSKEETLFKGSSSSSSALTHGGISVASLPSSTGDAPEESVMMWYGTEIHRIPDVAQWWARAASATSGASLSRPTISKVQGLKLLGEAITSIDQFDTTTKDARMAVPRDALISTEHSLIIITQVAQPLARDLNGAVDDEQAEDEDARLADQALLARGELDLGGMDRLLEDMEGSGTGQQGLILGGPRRVLFASSAA